MSIVPKRRAPALLDPYGTSFRLLSDTLLAGVVVLALSLAVVTWLVALTGAVAALREARRTDAHVRVRGILTHATRAARRHPLLMLAAPTALVVFLVGDLLILPHVIGDARGSLVIVGALAAGIGALALRVAGAWRAECAASDIARVAWRRMSADPVGSVMLFGAGACAMLVVSFAPPLVFVMGGPLALAALAFDREIA